MKFISAFTAATFLAVGALLAAPPSITSQPLAIQILNAGSAATLSVSASGTALTYQWYQGARLDTSNPVGGNSSSFTTPSLATNSSYWVRVSSADGSVDSTASAIVVWPQGIRVGDQFAANLSPLASGGKTLKLVGKLPAGLSLNTKTWQISGTVTGNAGNFTPSIQVIQNKAVLQNISIPILVGNFPTSLLGNYEALLKGQNGALFGVFKLTTGKNVWTASLETLGQARRTAKGVFALQQGSSSASLEVKFAATKTAPALTLNFTLDGNSPFLFGTHGAGALEGFKMIDSLTSATNPILYNLIMDQGTVDALDKPAGKGWASGSFARTGIGTFKGMLGDATACSFPLRLSVTGQAILWAQPYANKNSFIGGVVDLVDLVPNANNYEALEPRVSWVKIADAKTPSYPNGFSFEHISVSGSRWLVPATHKALGESLGWLGGEKCTVIIYGAGLSKESQQSAVSVKFPTEFTLDKTFKLIAPVNSSTLKWSGSVVKGTGAFSGSFTLPTGFAVNTIAGSGAVSGLLLQEDKWGITSGLGLIKVPISGAKGSFRTAALTLEQYKATAPAITSVADQITTFGNSTTAIPFTINDIHTAASSLTLSASSSNTTLVPDANIVFGGSGADRTVTVTPANGQSGTATITVTVSDGWLSNSETFVLTVNANTAPTTSNIAAQTISENGNTGAISFTIDDTESAVGSLTVSGSSSNTTLVPNSNIIFSGSGANRTVTVTPASGQSGTANIMVTVSDGWLSSSDTFLLTVVPTPAGMAHIPQGAFTMGDSLDGYTYGDAPTRTVTLDAFYMGKYEVTKAEWDEVRTWAISNGYTDLFTGSGKASNHPVGSISWYDMLKWCNARSQKEGLTPVYYTNIAQTTIYKTWNVNVTNAHVKWDANGYRLPTEAEWEKAARGGLSGKRFPWGDTISHSQANYYARDYLIDSYDLSSVANNYHPDYSIGPYPYTSPVGDFAANSYGLHDMAGNVSEWCWDWYGAYDAGSQINPRGATSGESRVVRGGDWYYDAGLCRVAGRHFSYPTSHLSGFGFRVVRSFTP